MVRLAVLVAGLAFSSPSPARASPAVPSAPDAGVDLCLPLRAENQALQEKLGEAHAASKARARKITALEAKLGAAAQRASGLKAKLSDTQSNLDAACRSTDALAESVVLSAPIPAGAKACVAPAHQDALEDYEKGLGDALVALDGLEAFSNGEADRPPRAPLPKTELEAAVARLLGTERGAPEVVYRRLLVEAVRKVAPRFWASLRARSTRTVERWLDGKGPLAPALIEEVRKGAQETGAKASSTALLGGLELLRAFGLLADCDGDHPPKGCARADQMETLLETSSPLLVGRREEGIWATECKSIGPDSVREWFADLPGSPKVERGDWDILEDAAYAKLFGCFLRKPGAGSAFGTWLSSRLPSASDVTGPVYERISGVRAHFTSGGPDDLCAQAVRALQQAPSVRSCALRRDLLRPLEAWHPGTVHSGSLAQDTCTAYARALWRGKAPVIPAAFGRPPDRGDAARLGEGKAGLANLRAACEDRRGTVDRFPDDLRRLAKVARAWGDDPVLSPWHATADGTTPIEAMRYQRAASLLGWAHGLLTRTGTCSALHLSHARCLQCVSGGKPGARYDCALRGTLRAQWDRWNESAWALVLALLVGGTGTVWGTRLRRARKRFGQWSSTARGALGQAGLRARPRRFRLLFPSRHRTLVLDLPRTPDWERWGKRAVVVRSGRGGISAREVDEAAAQARERGTELALLVHDEGVSPELGAVRAMLDWAVRGTRGVQVLPVAQARLEWVRGPGDLLDLVEQISLRGNPFEVRGRITSASQFFDRERIVSGLLAGVQAGSWTLITGLRRMGKSSVALEVARQLDGPSAYVDFAGFHHEMAHVEREEAASAVLRYVCLRLAESARERFGVEVPPPPEGALDASRLTEWFSALGRVSGGEGKRGRWALVIFDELEQAIGVGPERVERALDVLATVLGRLRTALGEPGSRSGNVRVGLLLCGAIHPLLWSPLAPLAGGSLMSALPRVVVPRLDDDAAAAMMRGLGARQGIRFTEEALELMIREAQGIPLLVRRLGSSVLELYDPERARQGGLGAVEVGLEGASAAVRREEDEGAPLRVWVDSEIGDGQSPAGRVLRRLAESGTATADELRALARAEVHERLAASGAIARLEPSELDRRAEEASSTLLQLLVESGLVKAEGDLTRPERYALPDGLLRRILNRARMPGPFDLP